MARSYKSAAPSLSRWRIHSPCRRPMAPKALDALEALQPKPSLSRAWPAPTRARPRPSVGGASIALVGGAHGPESGGCPGGASTETIALAGMARSYKSAAPSLSRWRIHRPCRRGPWPRKRWMPWRRFNRNHRFRGHGPLLLSFASRIRAAPMRGGHTHASARRLEGPSRPSRDRHDGDISGSRSVCTVRSRFLRGFPCASGAVGFLLSFQRSAAFSATRFDMQSDAIRHRGGRCIPSTARPLR
jgi:hypothetical protein